MVEPVINVWDASSGQLATTIKGHALTVCGVAISVSNNALVSVSWDKTARVWDLGSLACKAMLQGHEAAVWAALPLEDGSILTGSADKTIKLWRGTACERTLRGHTDCVRALARVEVGFASAGNDSVIRLWTLSGDCIMEMSGHTSFIYSIAVLPTGELASASEDKTARVWRNGECVGTVQHVGSVWTVAALPNGDLVTGCADAIARIWTRDPARMADPALLQRYDETLAAQTISAQVRAGDSAWQWRLGRPAWHACTWRVSTCVRAFCVLACECARARVCVLSAGACCVRTSRAHVTIHANFSFSHGEGGGVFDVMKPVRALPIATNGCRRVGRGWGRGS